MGGRANKFKFEEYIKPEDTVLDFGCGGGYLLAVLDAKKKYGIEINEYAREEAKNNGVICVERIEDMPKDKMDVIISNHCLEHVTNPYEVLIKLRDILKDDGKIIFVVPNENSLKVNYYNRSRHLWTWTPQNLANLFMVAGYEVIEAECIKHRWIPKKFLLQRAFGWKGFHILCRLWSIMTRSGYQTRVIARKNMNAGNLL